MPFPQDLLEQAGELVQKDDRRPKQASLRRAVSTAYYALFHLLIEETVRSWNGPGSRKEKAKQRAQLGRMFEHAFMKKACQRAVTELKSYFKGDPPADDPHWVLRNNLRILADTFVRMQESRQIADYDSATKWKRTDAKQKIQDVTDAFERWASIRDQREAQLFLISLLLKDRK